MALCDLDANKVLEAKYVRVTEKRTDGLVGFDFAIGEPEIYVELLMPEAAFRDFCRTSAVIDITAQPDVGNDDRIRLSRVAPGQER
ncbi:toluene monooxygenase [Sphingomonas sp. Root710]|uniref:phenol hydroxylase subunit n=1 Tax=Sphingomonas sp. Root710 TaxID=1736594 RepID=UPI0006F79A34|nr:phenol hydroxylase subunit [Sphingomonas sp. Root710]KRB83914.1 toluene monooxygenase [Sphingomonas sp. Root710]